MIIKGKSRAGPSQLARHLGRADTNERVELLELAWGGNSVQEAFRDWQVISEGTKGRLGLYHANIDPDAKYAMTRDQWLRAVEVLEEELGLQGQPRAIVMHEKNGREHIHVVWARTDMDTMKLRSDSMNYQAHERASLRLEQEFGHEHVPGKHAKRDRQAQPEFPSAEAQHDEWQQGERGGMNHRDRKAQVKGLYEASDTGPAFKAALEDAGYVLARGDRRDFVILDSDTKVHSLGRQLPGVTAKDLCAFMADINPDMLPSVSEARAAVRENARAEPSPGQSQAEAPAPDKNDAAPIDTEADRQRLDTLRKAISERHSAELKEQELRHAREVTELQTSQQAAADKAIKSFSKEQARRTVAERPQVPGGFDRLWRSIREAVNEEARTQRLAIEAQHARDAEDRRSDEIRIMVGGMQAAQRQEIDNLVKRQGQERADLLDEQDKDLKRRIADDQRAVALEREYERRRIEALARERVGPERDDRAR
ncbi:relaxase/mobilization nuclease domain-containing protein [Qipengyuania sediminis]|uniref:relaxase/mobilization nuclease domain-containing protein n=1 Tax=Qipengyuania sediminis TaxID=1532023 RepID=UPI00105A994F|nr:relaxase/mobilization nuclease domain-containing protein [Qipengyuania sediminis]